MEDINKLRIINKLKSIYRANSVEDRKESSAEHSWSSLIIADYFITKYNIDVDRLRVYELLIYHDLIEIEEGDQPLDPNKEYKKDKEKTKEYAKKIKEKLPKPLGEKYYRLFIEFEERKTKEAKFAKAIDALDAEIHELDYKKDWKGWSKEFLIKSKKRLMKDFPELEKVFNGIIEYLEKNNYFENQRTS